MWVLLLMVMSLNTVGVPTIIVALKKSDSDPFYATEAECVTERDRIDGEMRKAYPSDSDYKLECKPVPRRAI